MGHDFIDDLIDAVRRAMPELDAPALKEILIVSGMPRKTENFRYLGFNRQETRDGGRALAYSAVAVLNNRRSDQWRISGTRRKISRWVFDNRWTRNPMDIFLHAVRSHPRVPDLLGAAPGGYTLLGILQEQRTGVSGVPGGRRIVLRPVVATARLGEEQLQALASFEAGNEIREIRIGPLPLYHKSLARER